MILPPPARYFPPRHGRYEVSPGLKPLGTPFGNGLADDRLFPFDSDFPRFRRNKLRCRAERLDKYVCFSDYDPRAAAAVARFLIARLCEDEPGLFQCETGARGATLLHCRLTGERLTFDADMRLTAADNGISPAYASAFDALCCQIPDDLAIVTRAAGKDRVAALHLCAPSHWAAEEKIGQDFIGTHAPVPGFEKVNAAAPTLVEAMITRGPFVRFTWGIEFDDRLNHHPVPPPGIAAAAWNRRGFDPERADRPTLFLRVERQVVWGLPEIEAACFAIRVFVTDASEIRADPERRTALRAALLSLSPESRRYKGLPDGDCFDSVIAYLDTLPD